MADFSSGRVWAAWATPGPSLSDDAQKKVAELCDKWREKGLCATDKIGGWPGGFQYADVKTEVDRSLNMYRIIKTDTRKCFEDHQRMAQEESVAVLNNFSVHVDPYLHMAGLKNSVCGIAIQIAVKKFIFPPNCNTVDLWKNYAIDYIAIHYAWARTYLYWSKDLVAELYKNANWDEAKKALESKKTSIAALFSAKHFMQACVEMKLGIRFAAQ